MTVTPIRDGKKRPVRTPLVWLAGAMLAAVLGLVAAAVRPEQFWLVFGVFTACCLSPCIGLAWLVLGGGRLVTPDPHADENVESRWLEKAASAALFDVAAAAGLTAGAVSLFGLDLPGDLALLGVVAFALVDAGLRYAVLARRGS
jgi:hypothetical protein